MNINDILLNIVEQVKEFAAQKRVIIRPIINDKCSIITNKKEKIEKIIKEILKNRIKNNPANTMIAVSIRVDDDILNICIKDNGLQKQIEKKQANIHNITSNATRISIAIPLLDVK